MPQQGAVRRGVTDSFMTQTEQRADRGVTMPEDIAQNPVQAEIWSWVAPPDNTFTQQDLPNLRMLVYWHAVAAEAQQTLNRGGVGIEIFDQIGEKPFKGADGEKLPLMRKHPALQVLKEASSEIRALSDMLGLSPLARSRIGLMQATTAKTAAETAATFLKGIDAEYEIDAAYELPGGEDA